MPLSKLDCHHSYTYPQKFSLTKTSGLTPLNRIRRGLIAVLLLRFSFQITHPSTILQYSHHSPRTPTMLLNSMTLAAVDTISIAAPDIPSSDIVNNLYRLTQLTGIAQSITHYVVYLNNPVRDRNKTIGSIEAIGTQATLDRDFMSGQTCGTMTKRSGSNVGRSEVKQNTTYTPAEQAEITDNYIAVSSHSTYHRLCFPLPSFLPATMY